MGPCCVSTSSQSYPLCASCSATVGLCAFRNKPIFGLPSRSCFLKSAPLRVASGITVLLNVYQSFLVYRRHPESAECQTNFRIRCMPRSHKFILASHYNRLLNLVSRGAACVGHRAEEAMTWKIAATKAGAADLGGCISESGAF